MSLPIGNPTSSVFRFLLLAACGVFGGFLFLVGILSSLERYQTESWVAREAVVTVSKLSSSFSKNGQSTTNWYPLISVRFLDAEAEVRVAVAYGRWLGWNDQVKQNAEKDLERYPVGSVVTVYHAPDDVRKAVLERHPWHERIFLVPLGFILLSIPFIVMSREQARRKNDSA